MKVALGALALFCLLSPLGASQGASEDVASRVGRELSAGRYGAAMAATKGLAVGPQRAALEAEVLYLAHSYDEALIKARSAFDGGQREPALLSRGASAALWIQDGAAALEFVDALDLAIEELGLELRAEWIAHAQDLRAAAVELQRLDAGVADKVRLARSIALGLLALGAGAMLRLLRRA